MPIHRSLPAATCETCRQPFRARAAGHSVNRFCSVACATVARRGRRWVGPRADGCWLHPACGTCPFPVCVVNELPPHQKLGGYLRRFKAAEVVRAGGDQRDVQTACGIGYRQAYRLVAEARAALADERRETATEGGA